MTSPRRDDPADTPKWWRYLRFWGANVGAEVDDEISFHLEELVGYYVARGIAPDEARRIATERFGDREHIALAMRTLATQRETAMQRTEWMDSIRRDVRYAVRQLANRPAFTCVALVTLALGIGANTAIFSAVNAVLLHPVATPQIDRLMVVRTNLPTLNLMSVNVGPGEALDLMARKDLFETSGAWAGRGGVVTEIGDPRRVAIARTMGRFFDVFRIAPALGRFYRPDESEPGKERVVVLSYALWRELGADRSLIGKQIVLSGVRLEVVGVAPASFDYPRGTQLYAPIAMTPQYAQNRNQLIWNVVGRMKSGITREQFDAGVLNEQQRWHRDLHYGDSQFLSVVPLVTMIAGQLRPALLVLLGAVGFVLLIACANIASLQLVHGTARSRELAVRAALGAGRGTIVRQLLVENFVLSIAGGLIGLGVGAAILKLMAAAGAAQMPALSDVRLSAPALVFTGVATLVAGALFGLLPALRAGRVDVQEALKDGSGGASLGGRRSRLLHTSVVVQVALTLVLLVGSGLMIRSLRVLLSQNPGFNSEHVATMKLTVTGPRYQPQGSLTTFYDQLLDRLSAMSELGPVGLVNDLPFSGDNDSSPFTVIGRAPNPNLPAMHANMHTVGGDYFKAMGIPLLRGRVFDQTDIATPNQALWVAVIDETLAKTYFPNEDPIGKRINQGPDATIIGVVGTVSQGELGEPSKSAIYYSYKQHNWASGMYVVTRTTLPTAVAASRVRAATQAIDPNIPLFSTQTLDERIAGSLAPRRLAMVVLTGLAALSLGLAVFGLYGVISYAVSQRTREFGIRIALGARPSDVQGMVLRQGVLLAFVGVAVGLAGAFLATRALSNLLFGVSSRDPFTFIAGPIILTIVAVAASYLPARRATKTDPLTALRST
ncbi:MAG TPA: ABC transporter permease [Gemmatimonadaceae bacterium]|nr:ABC transporter permease [Gemmatimonadaceae bacterium]